MTDISCSDSSAAEPLAGTAPLRKVWFIIEQPGAWGREALVESDLPEGFGEQLLETITSPEIGIAVARRADVASSERRTTRRRRLWLAHTSVGGVRMRAGSLDDIRDVLKWDWNAILRGELPPIGRRSADPVLFVCTNGKRDACCALHARKIVDELRPDPELTGQIYEISHLGGHRFAPTALLLPAGIMYGRLDVESTRTVLSSAWSGQCLPESMRGRTSLPAYAQAAEIAVRMSEKILGSDALDVVAIRNGKTLPTAMVAQPADADVIEVRHQDGRTWTTALRLDELHPRPTSCGGDLEEARSWTVTAITASPRWHS